MLRLCVLLCLSSLGHLQPIENEEISKFVVTGNANHLIDGILNNVNKQLPVKQALPDIGSTLDLHNCFLNGLNTGIHRFGNASMNFVNGSIQIDVGVYLNSIGANCDWKYLLNHGSLEASVMLPTIVVRLESSLSTSAHPKLLSFKVAYLGNFEIEISGVGAFDKMVDQIAENEVNVKMRPEIIKEIETKVPPILQKELDKIHI